MKEYIRGSLNRFPDFFRRSTFIDSTHKTLVPFEVIFSGCNALVVPFQQLLEGLTEVLLWERVNDFRHRLSSFQLSHNDSLRAWGITKSHREHGLDYREGKKLSWCPAWSNSLWQGLSCGLVYCPGGNATDLIWRMLASSDEISSWTPLKQQDSNPNPNPLANQLSGIDFLTPPAPVIIPHRLPAFFESLMPPKTDTWFMQDGPKAVWSIPYVSVAFFSKFQTGCYCISFFLKSRLHFWNSPAVTIRL